MSFYDLTKFTWISPTRRASVVAKFSFSLMINESVTFEINENDWLLLIKFIECCDTLSIACAVINETTANVPTKKSKDFNYTERNLPIDKCGHVPKIMYIITGKKETYNPI